MGRFPFVRKKECRTLTWRGWLVLLLIVILPAMAAPVITNADPNDTDIRNAYAPASSDHPFGTDNLGRDIFTRVLFGARTSVSMGLTIVAVTTVAGSTIGFLSGYYVSLDAPLMRLIDMVDAFPAILLALCIYRSARGCE